MFLLSLYQLILNYPGLVSKSLQDLLVKNRLPEQQVNEIVYCGLNWVLAHDF